MGWSLGVNTCLKLYVGNDFACKLNDPPRVFFPLKENFCGLFALIFCADIYVRLLTSGIVMDLFLLERLLWKVFVDCYLLLELTRLFLILVFWVLRDPSKFICLDSWFSFRDIIRVMFGRLERLWRLLLPRLRIFLGPTVDFMSWIECESWDSSFCIRVRTWVTSGSNSICFDSRFVRRFSMWHFSWSLRCLS